MLPAILRSPLKCSNLSRLNYVTVYDSTLRAAIVFPSAKSGKGWAHGWAELKLEERFLFLVAREIVRHRHSNGTEGSPHTNIPARTRTQQPDQTTSHTVNTHPTFSLQVHYIFTNKREIIEINYEIIKMLFVGPLFCVVALLRCCCHVFAVPKFQPKKN